MRRIKLTINYKPQTTLNYLAHAYLSFHHPEILVGNMISDFVKGKKQFDYPVNIQKGIRLHRAIDTFTDQHPVTKKAKEYFKPAVGSYAGAFMDIVYDHFLALDINEFSDSSLQNFAKEVYRQLEANQAFLEATFALLLPYMSSQNWLYNYRYKEGMNKSFGGLVRRAKYLSTSAPAYEVFLENYTALRGHYHDFFPDVKKYALSQFILLLQD